MKLQIQQFFGVSPRANAHYLPDGCAQIAENVEALKAFQQAEHLVVDGICGRASWERLLDVGDD